MTGQPGCRHTDRSVPSCRHSDCDSSMPALTCEDTRCDGICEGGECRHNRPRTPLGEAQSRRTEDAVTEQGAAEWAEISTSDDRVTVRVPAEMPTLNPRVARALLAILVELTDVPVLDRPGEGTRDDR